MRLTIGQRAALAFAFMVILVLAASLAGLLYSNAVEDTIDATQNGTQITGRLNQVEFDWFAVAAVIDQMLLSRQVSLVEQVELQLAGFNQQVAALQAEPLGSNVTLAAENQALLDRLERQRVQMNDVVIELTAAAQAREWAAAQVLRHTDMMSIQRRINESLTAIIQNVQADVDQSIADADDARALARFYMSLTAVLAVVVGLVAGYLTVSGVTSPIRAMARTAEALRAGDLSRRVDVRQPGVLGVLATAFNDMAAQIQRMVSSLEERVAARTRDLQIAAQVSEQAATLLDPEQLLSQVVELTKAGFDLYHTHIYLLDDDEQTLVLAAGAGEAGRIMKQRGHRIAINARSLVAQAARENQPVVVDDVTQFEGFLQNPLLPATRSEAAFPLSAAGRVLGVLDAQSDRVARFDADAQAVLSTLAGQIAVAAQNASLFAEVDRRGRHERALSAITEAIQRATSVDEVLQAATRELGRALRVPHTAIELQLPRDLDESEVVAASLETSPGR